MRAPELVVDGFPKRRSRWVEIATSADHKDVGRMLITASLGFLFIAAIDWLLMRMQLAIPENTFLSPVTFNRILSIYGTTAIFFFAVPLVMGFFYYLVPLQIGARGTALPRVGQLGAWLVIAGATVLYSGFLFTPSEAGINPLPPLSELSFLSNDGVDAWTSATGLATLGFVLISIDLTTTMRRMRAPGMAWRRLPVFTWAAATGSWLMLVIGPVFLAALTMLEIDRNFDGIFFADGSGGAPLLWQHLSWIFFTGVYMLVLIAALGTIAEIVSAFARKPLFNRGTVIASLVAIAVLGTLAWMQNMLSAPIGIGWMYFAMIFSLALIVPVGLILFNLIATLAGGTIRMRAPLLFAAGAVSMISIGLAAEIEHSMVAVAWQLKNTTDATAATHFALIGGGVFGGFAALHFWFPKMTGRTMGESLGRISFWTLVRRHPGRLRASLPRRHRTGSGDRHLQVLRRHRRRRLQPDLDDRLVRPRDRDRPGPDKRDRQPRGRRQRRPRPLGRGLARVVRALAPGPAQLRRPARRTQRSPDARHPRGDLPQHEAC